MCQYTFGTTFCAETEILRRRYVSWLFRNSKVTSPFSIASPASASRTASCCIDWVAIPGRSGLALKWTTAVMAASRCSRSRTTAARSRSRCLPARCTMSPSRRCLAPSSSTASATASRSCRWSRTPRRSWATAPNGARLSTKLRLIAHRSTPSTRSTRHRCGHRHPDPNRPKEDLLRAVFLFTNKKTALSAASLLFDA